MLGDRRKLFARLCFRVLKKDTLFANARYPRLRGGEHSQRLLSLFSSLCLRASVVKSGLQRAAFGGRKAVLA